jgi:hypothetical protein
MLATVAVENENFGVVNLICCRVIVPSEQEQEQVAKTRQLKTIYQTLGKTITQYSLNRF